MPPPVEPSTSPFVNEEVYLPIHLKVARQSSWLCDRATKQFTTGTELTMLNNPHVVQLQLYKRPIHLSTYCMLSYVGFLALPKTVTTATIGTARTRNVRYGQTSH